MSDRRWVVEIVWPDGTSSWIRSALMRVTLAGERGGARLFSTKTGAGGAADAASDFRRAEDERPKQFRGRARVVEVPA